MMKGDGAELTREQYDELKAAATRLRSDHLQRLAMAMMLEFAQRNGDAPTAFITLESPNAEAPPIAVAAIARGLSAPILAAMMAQLFGPPSLGVVSAPLPPTGPIRRPT